MDWENPLDPNALKDTSNGNRRLDSGTVLRNHNPLVGLNALFISFLDQNADFDRIANVNLWKRCL